MLVIVGPSFDVSTADTHPPRLVSFGDQPSRMRATSAWQERAATQRFKSDGTRPRSNSEAGLHAGHEPARRE
jgi:hypothetical protein